LNSSAQLDSVTLVKKTRKKIRKFKIFTKKEKIVKMSIDEYPIIDFSEIPGCESPIVPRSSVRFLCKDYEKPN
jgi:hypothetical protein